VSADDVDQVLDALGVDESLALRTADLVFAGEEILRALEVAENLTPIDGGYRVKLSRDGRHYIDLMRMIFNWRVVTTPVRMPCVIDRGWCYFGVGPASFRNAVMAALVWSGSDHSEPAGYDKRVGPPPTPIRRRHARRHRARVRPRL
jgi:hypothetical protein